MNDTRTATEVSLDKDGLLWLLVGAVGFFFGMAWISGPLAWYFSRRLKAEAEDARVKVPDTLRAAHVVGIVTTVITYIAFVIIAAVVVMMFVVGGAAAISH